MRAGDGDLIADSNTHCAEPYATRPRALQARGRRGCRIPPAHCASANGPTPARQGERRPISKKCVLKCYLSFAKTTKSNDFNVFKMYFTCFNKQNGPFFKIICFFQNSCPKLGLFLCQFAFQKTTKSNDFIVFKMYFTCFNKQNVFFFFKIFCF